MWLQPCGSPNAIRMIFIISLMITSIANTRSSQNNMESLEPTQVLSVTLVTPHRVCSVTSVTLHKSLFIIHLRGELQGQLPVQTYRTSYGFRSTGPVVSPDLQDQLWVQIYMASCQSRPTGPVMGPDLQGQ